MSKNTETGWAVKRERTARASFIEPTQADAIETAEEMNPKAVLHIQRLNKKWRKSNPFDPT
jgi:hypothetical protein